MQPLVPLVFHNLPPLYPPSFRRNDFFTCFTDFWLCQCTMCKKRFVYINTRNYHSLLYYWSSLLIPPFPCSRIYIFSLCSTRGSNSGPHRYDRSHKPRIVHTTSLNFHTRVRAGEAHYPKWRRSLLIRADTRHFHLRRGNGEERSLGDDAHL